MKWEAFECDECHLRYALEQTRDDEIEEPSCPSCNGTYSIPLEVEVITITK
jgi:NAD-dependent SIR2 family protein deacetylase